MTPARKSLLKRIVLPLATGAILVAAWSLLMPAAEDRILPSPGEVVEAVGRLLREGTLFRHVVASLFRVSVGFALAAVVGVPLGLLMGWSNSALFALNPLVQVLRPISPIAWIPIAILAFGVSDAAPIMLIFLSSVFVIVVSTVTGVRTIPLAHVRVARNFGVGGWSLLTKVLLPGALPQIITGMRVGLGIAWMVVVAAEMIAVQSGLGFLIIDARNSGRRYDLVVAAMLMIGLIGLAIDFAMRRLERLDVVRWRFSQETS